MERFCHFVRYSGLFRSRIWSIGIGYYWIFVSLGSVLIVTQAPMFGDYIVAFDSNLTDVVQFTGVAILVLGFSNFIWYAFGILNMELY